MTTTFTTHRTNDNSIQLAGSMADMRCGAAGLARGEYFVHDGNAVVGAFRITHRCIEEIDRSTFVLQSSDAITARVASPRVAS